MKRLLLAIALVLIFCLPANATTNYTITDLGVFGGSHRPGSWATGINNSGQVVGASYTSSGEMHPFLWKNEMMIDLGGIGQSLDINNSGQVVGYSDDHAFLWENGSMIDLGTFGGTHSFARGINDSGQIVGNIYFSNGNVIQLFIWENGTVTYLGNFGGNRAWANDINNSGQVLGWSIDTDRVFIWENDTTTFLNLPGSSRSEDGDINDSGQVVVQSDDHAFLWENGSYTDLGTLGADWSEPFSINNYGVVVGRSQIDESTSGWDRAFIWENGVMTDLNELVPDYQDWRIHIAYDINDNGQIAAYGRNGDGEYHAFLLTPIVLWYVDGDIAASGNGTSWAEAFKTIQEAIDAADADDIIWVKQGTYFVTPEIDVDKSVAIYGGFDGTETQMSERNWRTNVTTVDGQNTNRCFQFRDDAILDGFTIAHGHTNWGGGGIYINNNSTAVTNCKFLENTAGTNGGGAINSWNATPTITNCLFLENDSGSNGGGAIYNSYCPAVTVTNCTFSQNDGGSTGGGAIYNDISSATIINSILWGDSADTGIEAYNEGGSLTISHSDLAGGIPGVVNTSGGMINDDGGNIAVNPLFEMGYHLMFGSDCIDAGDNNAPALPLIDLDGNPRIIYGVVDMGAYEFIGLCMGDFEPDGDVDGSDLRELVANPAFLDLSTFAAEFGGTDCLFSGLKLTLTVSTDGSNYVDELWIDEPTQVKFKITVQNNLDVKIVDITLMDSFQDFTPYLDEWQTCDPGVSFNFVPDYFVSEDTINTAVVTGNAIKYGTPYVSDDSASVHLRNHASVPVP